MQSESRWWKFRWKGNEVAPDDREQKDERENWNSRERQTIPLTGVKKEISRRPLIYDNPATASPPERAFCPLLNKTLPDRVVWRTSRIKES